MLINDQPIPIISHIIKYLPCGDHFMLRIVSKKFKSIIDSESISGLEPSNIYDAVLSDSIYFFKKYSSMMLLNIENIISIFGSNLCLPPNINYLQLFKNFHHIYMPNSKINQLIKLNIDNFEQYRSKLTYYMIDRIVSIGDLDLIVKLFSVLDDKIIDPKYYTLLCAASYGYLHIIKYIEEIYPKYLSYCDFILLYAIKNNHPNIIKYVIKTSPDKFDHYFLLETITTEENIKYLKYLVKDNGIKVKVVNKLLQHINSKRFTEVNLMLTAQPLLVTSIANNFTTGTINQMMNFREYNMVKILSKHGIPVNNFRYICSISIYYMYGPWYPLTLVTGVFIGISIGLTGSIYKKLFATTVLTFGLIYLGERI